MRWAAVVPVATSASGLAATELQLQAVLWVAKVREVTWGQGTLELHCLRRSRCLPMQCVHAYLGVAAEHHLQYYGLVYSVRSLHQSPVLQEAGWMGAWVVAVTGVGQARLPLAQLAFPHQSPESLVNRCMTQVLQQEVVGEGRPEGVGAGRWRVDEVAHLPARHSQRSRHPQSQRWQREVAH